VKPNRNGLIFFNKVGRPWRAGRSSRSIFIHYFLRGDDGTYTLLDTQATLVRDRPTRVRFAMKCTPGWHVAFLQLIDAVIGVVIQEVPLSVRVPHQPQTIAASTEEYQSTIPPCATIFATCVSVKRRKQRALQYDSPAPDVPITGTLIVTKYAVAFTNDADQRLRVTNKLADIEGKVESYDAEIALYQSHGEGPHASVDIQRTLPAHLAQWRVAISSSVAPIGRRRRVLARLHKQECRVLRRGATRLWIKGRNTGCR
jgi:hypothetical protein